MTVHLRVPVGALTSEMATATFTPIINPPRDPNTLSNYNNWRSTHITANFDILFDQQKLVGNVVHRIKSITNAESRDILLDTSHLDIGDVKVDGKSSKWEILPAQEPYGNALKIHLEHGVQLNAVVEVDVRAGRTEPCPFEQVQILTKCVQIAVKTTDKCTALQWLTPAQTSTKKQPYMCKSGTTQRLPNTDD